MDETAAIERARALFLDPGNVHGCAETAYLVLCEAYGVGDPATPRRPWRSTAASPTAAGHAVRSPERRSPWGSSRPRRIDDHREAKRAARELTAELMEEVRREHGATDCRALIGIDLRAPGGHEAFIRSGVWQDRCMRQIETAVRYAVPLARDDTWAAAVVRVGGASGSESTAR